MKLFASFGVLVLGIALTSCGGGSSTPTPSGSVTGQWSGTLNGNKPITINIAMTQNNQAGDFSGTFTAIGIAGSAAVSGNVQKGTLVGIDSSGYLACSGTFTNYNQYDGDCVLAAGSSQIVKMSIRKI